jgi:hypothetical protein
MPHLIMIFPVLWGWALAHWYLGAAALAAATLTAVIGRRKA